MTTTHTTDAIDWVAATAVAERLGAHTRLLVAAGYPQAVIDWALRMAQENGVSAYMVPRVASYIELAVLLGHHDPLPESDPIQAWALLKTKAEQLAAAVEAQLAFARAEAEAKPEADAGKEGDGDADGD
jgi:hypothetical protein